MACSMCSGTDCADACNQGYCYAEEMQRRWEEEEAAREMEDQAAREEEWEQQMLEADSSQNQGEN